MVTTAETLVARAGRLEKAAELEKGILRQVRAENDIILSTSDAEVEQFAAEMGRLRTAVAKTKDEIFAPASEEGKKLIEQFGAVYRGMNAVQDHTATLPKLYTQKAAT